MTNWIRTHRVKFYLMVFLALFLALVGCAIVFATPNYLIIPTVDHASLLDLPFIP